jgi:hypothetical protein
MRSELALEALTRLYCLPRVVPAQIMSVDQAATETQRVNPPVPPARFRPASARHQIVQNYTLADPQFAFTDRWRGFLDGSWLEPRSTYLRAANALLAGKVALEQAAGGSLQ